MRPLQILVKVELPLALPLIFAGIRTAAVFVVATATLGGIVGGGGLGDIIVNQSSYFLRGVSPLRSRSPRSPLPPTSCSGSCSGRSRRRAFRTKTSALRAGSRRPRTRTVGSRLHPRSGLPEGPTGREGRRDQEAHPARRQSRLLRRVRSRTPLRRARRNRDVGAEGKRHDQPRHQGFHRGIRPRSALQAGAGSEGHQGRLSREHRVDGDHPDGSSQREDQCVSGVRRRDRPDRVPQDDRPAEDRARLVGAGEVGARQGRLRRSPTRRRSTTSTRSPCGSRTRRSTT